MKHWHQSFSVALAVSLSAGAFAQTDAAPDAALPEIKVRDSAIRETFLTTPAGDAARLLGGMPGYGVAASGGVSGLPVVDGFADDRLKVRIDGMEITSACGNHMNAPLSYIDSKQVGKIKLIAGIAPVSAGGDSIGAVIQVDSPAPVFAAPGEGLYKEGSVSLIGRSVDNGVSASVSAGVATESLSIAYSGAHARAKSYQDGNRKRVLDSLYERNNQSITLAAQGEGQQLSLRLAEQHIPYQGFPNQYMDMTDNHARSANLSYAGQFAWGRLDTRVYWQNTDHEMGFFSSERTGTMPMITQGRDLGYAVKAEMPLRENSILRLGHEYHAFRLDDYWPPVPGSMMMSPLTYININDGERDRLALYGELENQWSARWSTLVGLRGERVSMDAGGVQPYAFNMMNAADAAAAAAFNARSRARRDSNLDLTALARYQADSGSMLEFGYARKTRSPNLYERYAWGRGGMAMRMTNWFGDGNGYVGSMDLQPEVAHTVGVTAGWHAEDGKRWFVKVNPYFSYVEDYIDTDLLGSFVPYMVAGNRGNLLQFANHDARLYGVNVSWRVPVWRDGGFGEVSFLGNAGITRGERTDGDDLYRMMPLNALLALEHARGNWLNTLEAKIVSRKTRVDTQRLEPATAGYALFNLRTAYQWTRNVTLSAGISNLFDRAYADPLGGVYLSGLRAYGGTLQPLPGYGRSFDAGLSVRF